MYYKNFLKQLGVQFIAAIVGIGLGYIIACYNNDYNPETFISGCISVLPYSIGFSIGIAHKVAKLKEQNK